MRNVGLNNDTEYWALIVGVQSGDLSTNNWMITSAKKMYDCLLSSKNWQADHIKFLTGRHATKQNILSGLRWLERKADANDVVLVYFSTHGSPLFMFGRFVDLSPCDEVDGRDESLQTWYSIPFQLIPLLKKIPIATLTDDELNSSLDKLKSQCVCVIIESCYAGGFNDLNNTGRVVLMASKEDEKSGGDSQGGFFTNALLDSLHPGISDLNKDGFISAEEAFIYAKPKVTYEHSQTPTICDGYNGEIPLVISNYKIDFFDNVEFSTAGWTTIDHTNGIGGDLWHRSEIAATTPTHCWYLGDEDTKRYQNNLNNSLVSNLSFALE